MTKRNIASLTQRDFRSLVKVGRMTLQAIVEWSAEHRHRDAGRATFTQRATIETSQEPELRPPRWVVFSSRFDLASGLADADALRTAPSHIGNLTFAHAAQNLFQIFLPIVHSAFVMLASCQMPIAPPLSF